MDEPPDKPPRSKNEWGILIILSFFFCLLLIADLLQDFSPAKWSLPFFLISWVLLLFIHEFAHAAMARWLGWGVDHVCIGAGKLRASCRIFGMRTDFRTIPLSGYMVPIVGDLRWPQGKQSLIYAAGPGSELLLVGLLVSLLGPEAMLSRTEEIWLIAIQAFSVAALLGALLNLIPFSTKGPDGRAMSDGLGILVSWKIPTSDFRARMKAERGKEMTPMAEDSE
ncbi:MAG: site-2 protease family protein [Verrucomicrobiota bacterium]